MKSLIVAAALLTSVHAFASPAELFVGTWEGDVQSDVGTGCTVKMVITAGPGESALEIDHSLVCDNFGFGDRGGKWILNLRNDGLIGPDGVDGEHLQQNTWSRTEIKLLDDQNQDLLQLKRSNPLADVLPYLNYSFYDTLETMRIQLTGVLKKTK